MPEKVDTRIITKRNWLTPYTFYLFKGGENMEEKICQRCKFFTNNPGKCSKLKEHKARKTKPCQLYERKK